MDDTAAKTLFAKTAYNLACFPRKRKPTHALRSVTVPIIENSGEGVAPLKKTRL